MDAGPPEMDAGPPEMDAGPPEMDAGPVSANCAAISDAGLMVCQMSETACEAISDATRDCNATCALAGLVCSQSVPDSEAGECAPEPGGAESNCDQAGRMADYCFCEAE